MIQSLTIHLNWRGDHLACGRIDKYKHLMRTDETKKVSCRRCKETLRFKLKHRSETGARTWRIGEIAESLEGVIKDIHTREEYPLQRAGIFLAQLKEELELQEAAEHAKQLEDRCSTS